MKTPETNDGRASGLARFFDAVRGRHRLFFRRVWRAFFRTLGMAGGAAAGFALDKQDVPLILILFLVTLCFVIVEELVPKDY